MTSTLSRKHSFQLSFLRSERVPSLSPTSGGTSFGLSGGRVPEGASAPGVGSTAPGGTAVEVKTPGVLSIIPNGSAKRGRLAGTGALIPGRVAIAPTLGTRGPGRSGIAPHEMGRIGAAGTGRNGRGAGPDAFV